MDSCRQFFGPGVREKAPAIYRYAKIAPHQRLCRGCAEADYQFRPNRCQFRFEPRATGRYFDACRLRMNAAFAALDKLEVFYGVRHVNDVSIDLRIVQRLI